MKKSEATKVIEKLLERIEVTNEEEQSFRLFIFQTRIDRSLKN